LQAQWHRPGNTGRRGKKLTDPGRWGLFEFAHSLGYPHPDLMLETMTAAQYLELLTYFRIRSDAEESGEAEAQEARTMQFLARKAAQKDE